MQPMKPRIATLATLLCASLLAVGCGGESSTSPESDTAGTRKKDSLVILSARVVGSMAPDSSRAFEFVVRYRLESRDSAERNLGFNSAERPEVFTMDSRYDSVVYRGSGEFRILASVPRRVYESASPFKGYVNLSPLPTPTSAYLPLAGDQKVLIVPE